MKIIQTVPLEETLPPLKYGGTELVAHLITEELVKRGHEVYLLAAGGSKTSAKLIPIVSKPIRQMYDQKALPAWRDYWKMASVSKIIHHINEIKPDIIHNHFAWRLILFEELIKYPMLSTIHGPLTSVTEVQTYSNHSNHPYISISNNQRKALPKINWLQTVYNGIDTEKFEVSRNQSNRKYFAFLGRTSPEKGLAEIIQMIQKTKEKLVIAAKVDSVDEEYFAKKIKPFIDGKKIKFLGEVDHKGKEKLLRGAKALLLWLNWEEPFGLVVTEANACGTPVIVNQRGSMPELLVDGINGFLINSIEEMKDKLAMTSLILPSKCRARVEEYFSIKSMVNDYLKAYEKVISNYAGQKN